MADLIKTETPDCVTFTGTGASIGIEIAVKKDANQLQIVQTIQPFELNKTWQQLVNEIIDNNTIV